MEKFNIDNQYQLYLQRVGLCETTMSKIQNTEMKRVFFAAFGIFLMMIKNDLSELSDDDAIKALDSIENQVTNFFLSETIKQN